MLTDFVVQARPRVIDATRISDGRLVYIKAVLTNSEELRILRMLSQQDIKDDPRNHCVPLLDVLLDDEDPGVSYIVMPFLRLVDNPPFETIGDAVDFVGQILEVSGFYSLRLQLLLDDLCSFNKGLEFIHDHDVAHRLASSQSRFPLFLTNAKYRDCAYKNIMMDADVLFPNGYHPVVTTREPLNDVGTKILPRAAGKIRYYYIDFGIASHLPQGRTPRLVLGRDGLDQSVPELSFEVPYDPFKVDVFIIGNLLKETFLEVNPYMRLHVNSLTSLCQKYSNVEFLRMLATAMTRQQPQERPTASDAHKTWRESRKDIGKFRLSHRLRARDEIWPVSIALDGVALLGQGLRIGKQVFAWIETSQG